MSKIVLFLHLALLPPIRHIFLDTKVCIVVVKGCQWAPDHLGVGSGPTTYCVTLGKPLNPSVSQPSQLWRPYLIGLLWELDELIQITYSEQLAPSVLAVIIADVGSGLRMIRNISRLEVKRESWLCFIWCFLFSFASILFWSQKCPPDPGNHGFVGHFGNTGSGGFNGSAQIQNPVCQPQCFQTIPVRGMSSCQSCPPCGSRTHVEDSYVWTGA